MDHHQFLQVTSGGMSRVYSTHSKATIGHECSLQHERCADVPSAKFCSFLAQHEVRVSTQKRSPANSSAALTWGDPESGGDSSLQDQLGMSGKSKQIILLVLAFLSVPNHDTVDSLRIANELALQDSIRPPGCSISRLPAEVRPRTNVGLFLEGTQMQQLTIWLSGVCNLNGACNVWETCILHLILVASLVVSHCRLGITTTEGPMLNKPR